MCITELPKFIEAVVQLDVELSNKNCLQDCEVDVGKRSSKFLWWYETS